MAEFLIISQPMAPAPNRNMLSCQALAMDRPQLLSHLFKTYTIHRRFRAAVTTAFAYRCVQA
jgi:hypothetical protein